MSALDPLLARLKVDRRGELVTIALAGSLDAHAGVGLLAALRTEVEAGADRVDIDLLAVDCWTPEGARALRRARRLARSLTAGLHYRSGPGAGHDALLDAYAEDEHEELGEDEAAE